MAECVDREAMLREIEQRERFMVGDKAISVDALKRFIENRPTVDAVAVTRCKDCRYRGLICCPAIHETIGNGLVDYAVDNGYCWCGKPKGDNR